MKKAMILCAVMSMFAATAMAWDGGDCGRGGPDPRGGGAGMKGFGPPGGGGLDRLVRDAEAAKSLGVTDEQLSQVREIAYQSEILQVKNRADLEIAQMELRRVLESAKPTEEAVGKAVDKISALEAQIQKARISEMLKIRGILGEEMIAKLRDSMREELRERAMTRERERSSRGDRPGSRREMGQRGGQAAAPQPPPAEPDGQEEDVQDDTGD